MRSLEFQTKGGVTLSRVNWEEKKSGAFHLDPWEADELEGIRAQGRRMWDNVGTRVTVRVYLFARSGVITSLGDIRVDKGDVKIEFEFEELQCVDCEKFLQVGRGLCDRFIVCVWCGVVWCGVVSCRVVSCRVVCVWCGVVWCGVVWCGVVWCGVVWCGVVWCGVVWWCGVVCLCVYVCVFVCVCMCVCVRACVRV